MSVFTNPAARSAEQAKGYTEAILELLGSRDPLGVLRETPSAVRAALGRVSPDRLTVPEAPGKWSVGRVVHHLADAELVGGYRWRMILAQDRPAITGYDQDLWAQRLGYDEADIPETLETFECLRRSNLRLLARATPQDLQRVGLHAERGEESVFRLVQLYAGHDLLHLRQIDRILAMVSR